MSEDRRLAVILREKRLEKLKEKHKKFINLLEKECLGETNSFKKINLTRAQLECIYNDEKSLNELKEKIKQTFSLRPSEFSNEFAFTIDRFHFGWLFTELQEITGLFFGHMHMYGNVENWNVEFHVSW